MKLCYALAYSHPGRQEGTVVRVGSGATGVGVGIKRRRKPKKKETHRLGARSYQHGLGKILLNPGISFPTVRIRYFLTGLLFHA